MGRLDAGGVLSPPASGDYRALSKGGGRPGSSPLFVMRLEGLVGAGEFEAGACNAVHDVACLLRNASPRVAAVNAQFVPLTLSTWPGLMS